MGKIKILAVSSLPAHRNAGLKAQLSVLKNDILPVPTVILSGVTSFSKVYKQTIDLQPLLEATMELCLEQNQSIVLYVGYLEKVENVNIVLDFIQKFNDMLIGIYVDPISGDNDKTYINHQIIELWPKLLIKANFAFPNLTELKLYSGLSIEETTVANHLVAFGKRFPNLNFIVTSYFDNDDSGIFLRYKSTNQLIRHKYYNQKIDGTGDLFVSFFMKYYLFEQDNAEDSCKKAIGSILDIIETELEERHCQPEVFV